MRERRFKGFDERRIEVAAEFHNHVGSYGLAAVELRAGAPRHKVYDPLESGEGLAVKSGLHEPLAEVLVRAGVVRGALAHFVVVSYQNKIGVEGRVGIVVQVLKPLPRPYLRKLVFGLGSTCPFLIIFNHGLLPTSTLYKGLSASFRPLG